MHVGARYYEVETGRFVQKDPKLNEIFNPLSLNLFAYCVNDPINRIDPKGEDWEWFHWGAYIGADMVAIGRTIVGPIPLKPGLVGIAGGWMVWVGSAVVAVCVTYMIFDKLADIWFPPDERCCGGECGRNPIPEPLPPIGLKIIVWPFPLSAIVDK